MVQTKACSSCGAEIPDGSRFCPQCGAPQAANCSACGHLNAPGSRFCAQCGAKLAEAAASAQSAAPSMPKPTPTEPTGARISAPAERRQLTVMFCDLVGSTALSTRLDPEDLRDVIADYHKHTADVVGRFGGFVAKYMGDGVLIYFGYPTAHETDAENAVRVGLALVETIDQIGVDGGRQQIRIGIATGLVVVGELIGTGEAQERNVVGETPNLAARLQSAAEPNTVVIEAGTRRLTGALFEYEAIEPSQLRGFDAPVRAWRVVRERSIESRFEALHAANLMPLVGREEEMELLLRRWQQVQNGEGRVVLMCGESGIGKSRLTVALQERLKPDRPVRMRYFCLPHHQGSALQPILSRLQHAAGFAREDSRSAKRAKLAALLAQGTDNVEEAVALFAELLGLSEGPSAAVADPQRRRHQVLSSLIEQLEGLGRQGPILMLFEDVQWADPTSLELLTLMIDRVQSLPVLLVITYRPDFQPPWADQSHVTTMIINRLARRERIALVEHLAGGKSLPADLLDKIVERTDGVPLFVEELTKSVLESELLHEDRGRYVVDRPAQQLEIPATLQASLMARVDRLGSAREVLQIGAAIGREFSYELLAAVAGLPDAVLQDALIRLTEAELVFLRGTPPNATYSFKHGLVQDAAYSTLLRTRRQQLHGAIAQALETRFPGIVESTPEVVAQQFELAGQSEKAIRYWQRAGDHHLRRFALKESIKHFENALRLVTAMPDTQTRQQQEIALCLALGLAQQIALGLGAKAAADCFRRAEALSRELPGHERARFRATWGLWAYCFATTQTEEELRRANELFEVAQEISDPDLLLEAYHVRMPVLQRLGNYRATKEAAEEVIQRYDRRRHSDHSFVFGPHDPRVCAYGFHAMTLWGLGLFDQADRMARVSIEDARELGHAYSLAHALQQTGPVFAWLDDIDTCQAVADELQEIAERNKFPWPAARARALSGWVACRRGDCEAGIRQMSEAADEPSSANWRPIMLAMLAGEQVRAGQSQAALAVLDRAAKLQESLRSTNFDPELTRLRGTALLQFSRDNESDAEACFQQALELARQQSCLTLALRAAASLAQLRREQGRAGEGAALLAPLYAEFTEGFDRPELQRVRELLAELN